MTNRTNLIFGIRAVIEAIRSEKGVDRLLIRKNLPQETQGELMAEARAREIPFQYVPVEKLDRITTKNHQGVIAFISPVEYQDLSQVVPMVFEQGKIPLFLMLDHITDVRNFGAIVRSAECGGVQAIIIPDKGAAQINDDAIKTSAGAFFNINICRVKSLEMSVKYLINCGFEIYAATEKGNKLYTNIDYNKPVCIIMGSEDTGVANSLLKISNELLYLPMEGKIESLNVSAAASIIIYEALRQRGLNK